MTITSRSPASSRSINLLVILSGFASLSWEVIWQIKSTLALGLSAYGTALTLAVTMGGMGIGGLVMGFRLRGVVSTHALKIYGGFECVIGLAGLFLNAGFKLVTQIDSWAYTITPQAASSVHILGIALLLGVPTFCMGATLPVFAILGRQFQVSVASLYGLNTLGAAAGSLTVALIFIPLLGITHSSWLVATLNIAVGLMAIWLDSQQQIAPVLLIETDESKAPSFSVRDIFIVFATGFATFTLEIAWFRSFSATFQNTADVFAIMLAAVLIALGWASRSVPKLKQRNKPLGTRLCIAGILVLISTPVVEWFDIIWLLFQGKILTPLGLSRTTDLLDATSFGPNSVAWWLYLIRTTVMLLAIFLIVAPPVRYLGIAFPFILDEYKSSRRTGWLYAVNTLAAILGSLVTAWVFLPLIGFARASWVAGSLVVVTGLLLVPKPKRSDWAFVGFVAFLIAFFLESGIGQVRMQGYFANMAGKPAKVKQAFDGPEATVSVVEYDGGGRRIIINSSSASGQSSPIDKLGEHYMIWMGHLPMLLHPDPKNALVICFGTGQTANAVRKENPESLDIVDINPSIFKLAHNFSSNEDVLSDSRVRRIVMDGRAYMRRAKKDYDVITLEPMPPNDAGVNALYSKEFYELAKGRLGPRGIIAQWLPFHSVAPVYSASIAKTFHEAFPNAVLWIDPETKSDGILLGSKDNSVPLATSWPGFTRQQIDRDLNQKEAQQNVTLTSEELKSYSSFGQLITDDNQLLNYGKALFCNIGLVKENFELLRRANNKVVVP